MDSYEMAKSLLTKLPKAADGDLMLSGAFLAQIAQIYATLAIAEAISGVWENDDEKTEL